MAAAGLDADGHVLETGETLEDGICIEAPVDETTLRPVTVESPLPADMAQFFR